jgi:Rieske Fe-S protein
VEPEQHGEQHALSLWPIGVAVGVGCILVGLLVSWWLVGVGAVIAIIFGVAWIYDVLRERKPEPPAPAGPPAAGEPVRRRWMGEKGTTTRKGFLSAMTLGLGAAIGFLVMLPSLIFAGVPPFEEGQGFTDLEVDLGPLENFPEGQWMITQFNAAPREGLVAERTAYVRNNGLLDRKPSFTIISNRCVHLGCPVQANGPVEPSRQKQLGVGLRAVRLTPVLPAGFGCPCHGGQYDIEGNRTAGPPVRALDRYAYDIKDGRLVLVGTFSVDEVDGSGKDATMGSYRLAAPGIHVDGVEQILYPFIPPS